MKTLICLALTLTTALPVRADYTVQVGALREPTAEFARAAESVGPVTTRRNADGITLFQVGPYATRKDAATALEALVDAGFEDAFIRSFVGAANVVPDGASDPRSVDLSELTDESD